MCITGEEHAHEMSPSTNQLLPCMYRIAIRHRTFFDSQPVVRSVRLEYTFEWNVRTVQLAMEYHDYKNKVTRNSS